MSQPPEDHSNKRPLPGPVSLNGEVDLEGLMPGIDYAPVANLPDKPPKDSDKPAPDTRAAQKRLERLAQRTKERYSQKGEEQVEKRPQDSSRFNGGRYPTVNEEREWRSRLGNTLFDVASTRGYSARVETIWQQFTVRFLEMADTDESIFEGLFPGTKIFEHSPNNSLPTVVFLKRHLRKVRGRSGQYSAIVESYSDSKLTNEHRHNLFLEREDLERRIENTGKRLNKTFERIKSVLKVWAIEADRAIIDAHTAESSHEGKRAKIGEVLEDDNPLDLFKRKRIDVRESIQWLWELVTSGRESDGLINGLIQHTLHHKEVPDVLSDAQEAGIILHLMQRDKLIKETVPLYCRWRAINDIIKRLHAGEVVRSDRKDGRTNPGESEAEPTGAAHKHTMAMGKALNSYRKKHGQYPYEGNEHLWNAGDIKKWLGNEVNREMPLSRTRVLEVLQETECWTNEKQGSKKGLTKSLDNTVEYYLKHCKKSEREGR